MMTSGSETVCWLQEFKLRAHLARHVATAHGSGEGARPVMKTRAAFFLRASPFTRLARRLAKALRRPKHYARSPFSPINLQQVKHECECTTVTRYVLNISVFSHIEEILPYTADRLI